MSILLCCYVASVNQAGGAGVGYSHKVRIGVCREGF